MYGIAQTSEEKDLVISEAKEILDNEDVIASIILVEESKNSKRLVIFIIYNFRRVGSYRR